MSCVGRYGPCDRHLHCEHQVALHPTGVSSTCDVFHLPRPALNEIGSVCRPQASSTFLLQIPCRITNLSPQVLSTHRLGHIVSACFPCHDSIAAPVVVAAEGLVGWPRGMRPWCGHPSSPAVALHKRQTCTAEVTFQPGLRDCVAVLLSRRGPTRIGHPSSQTAVCFLGMDR